MGWDLDVVDIVDCSPSTWWCFCSQSLALRSQSTNRITQVITHTHIIRATNSLSLYMLHMVSLVKQRNAPSISKLWTNVGTLRWSAIPLSKHSKHYVHGRPDISNLQFSCIFTLISYLERQITNLLDYEILRVSRQPFGSSFQTASGVSSTSSYQRDNFTRTPIARSWCIRTKYKTRCTQRRHFNPC